jgi:hypothetical protein
MRTNSSLALATFAAVLCATAAAGATNRYEITQLKTQPKLLIGLREPVPTSTSVNAYKPSYGEVEWDTQHYPYEAYKSYVMPRASVALICNDSGWRAWGLGVTASYNTNPSSYAKTATKVTADIDVPFYDAKGLTQKATAEWCPTAMAADLPKVPAAELDKSRTLTIVKPWKVRVTGECIRMKAPFVGKIEKVSATQDVQVTVECRYTPRRAYLDNDPVKLFWSSSRGDNFTATTAQDEAAAKAAGYAFVRNDARVQVLHAGGTTTLNLYWNAANGDNLSTTAAFSAPAGYSFVRKQGYVFASPQAYTVPLKLFWSAARKDYFSTATAAGEADAKAAGYTLVKIIGHVIPQK